MAIDKFEQLNKLNDKKEKQTIKRIARLYKLSLEDARKEIRKLYDKYSEGGILTYAEMNKYKRLNGLINEFKQELALLYKDAGLEINNSLKEQYKDNYYRIGFILETESQKKLAYKFIDRETIKKAINNPISGLTLSVRLNTNRNNIILKTQEQITQGLIQGEGYGLMSRRLKDVYEGNLQKAYRIVATETNRIRNEARNESYKHALDNGIEGKKVWVATLDLKTRDRHGKLDGKYADKKGYFHINGYSAEYPGGFGVAEMDINCRCTTRFEIQELKPEERRAKEEGKGIIIPQTNYETWYKNRISK